MKITILGGHSQTLRERVLCYIDIYCRDWYDQKKVGRYHAVLFTTTTTECAVWKTRSGGIIALIRGPEAKS